MTKTIGAEGAFISELINGRVDIRATMLRYGLIDKDVRSLISQPGMSISASQMLSGMLRARTVVGLSSADVECRVDGQLASVDSAYLKLAVSVGKTFVHQTDLSTGDKAVFLGNGVALFAAAAIDYNALSAQRSNVIESWSLTEGGNLRPVDVLLASFSAAQSVKIYDRYFGQTALDAIVEVLDALPVVSKSNLKITILVGREEGRLTSAQIAAAIGQRIVPANVRVTQSQKPGTYTNHLHDRYIQIDDSHTYVLAAGLGCFLGSNGKNRACNVFKHDLYISYVDAEVVASDTGAPVRFKY